MSAEDLHSGSDTIDEEEVMLAVMKRSLLIMRSSCYVTMRQLMLVLQARLSIPD